MRTEYSAVIAFIAAGLLIQPTPAPAAVIGVVGPAVAIRAATGKGKSAEVPASIGGALADAVNPQDGWGKWTGKSCLSELVKDDHLEKKYSVKYEDKTCKVVFSSPPSVCLDLVGKDQPKADAEKYGSAKKDGSNLVVSLPQNADAAKAYMHRLVELLPHKDVDIPAECGGKPKKPECEPHTSKPNSPPTPSTWATIPSSSTTTTTAAPSTWATMTTKSSTTTTTTTAAPSTWATIKSSTTTTKPSTTTNTTTAAPSTWATIKSSSTTTTTTKPTTTTTVNSTWATIKSTTTTTTKPTTTTTTTTTHAPSTWATIPTTTKKTTTTTTTSKHAPTTTDWTNTNVRAMRFMPRDE